NAERDPILARSAGLEERGLEVEFLFVDRPWSTGSKGFQAAFQLHERTEMRTEMPIRVYHVTLEKEGVRISLLSPVIVAGLFENLPYFASDSQIPIVRAETNVLQRIPNVLTTARVLEETPILVLAQQAVRGDALRGRRRRRREPHSKPHEG